MRFLGFPGDRLGLDIEGTHEIPKWGLGMDERVIDQPPASALKSRSEVVGRIEEQNPVYGVVIERISRGRSCPTGCGKIWSWKSRLVTYTPT